ncbi:MAG: TIGR03663 family protein [Caldilineaceae bacterium]|nr:TIGR03663 family protein [Caldilineaceae bacterium]
MSEQQWQVTATSDAEMMAEGESSWLDRSVQSLVRVNWETVAWVIIFVVAAVARFYDLGARAMSHDESLHSLYAYYLYENGNYEHNPMMHGPFRYHVTALVYFLFGDSDATARLAPALMGMGVIWMVYLYRRYIGQIGALAAGVMVTISPSLLFHSRYIRDDIFISFFTTVWVYGAMRYLDVQNRTRYRWLVVMVVSMGLAFATMENAFIHGAILGVFFAGLALWQVIKERMFLAASPALLGGGIGFWLFENGQSTFGIAFAVLGVVGMLVLLALWLGQEGWRKLRNSDAADLAVLMATLVLPFLSPFLHLVFGWDAMAHTTNTDMLRSAGLVLFMTAVAVAIAYFWFGLRPRDRKDEGQKAGSLTSSLIPPSSSLLTAGGWAQLMGLFWLIEVLFFTTFLTNTRDGLATGIVGSLGYWLAQHEVQRGNQPPYYYLMLAALYEFLPMLLSIGGVSAIVYWLRRDPQWDPAGFEPLPPESSVADLQQAELLRRNRVYFVVLLVWWSLGTWIGYSVAGEKMPWLLTHIALPMCVLGGWWFGTVVRKISWAAARQSGALWLMGTPIAAIFLLVVLSSDSPFQGRTVEALGSTMQWVLAFLALVGVGYASWLGMKRIGVRAALRVAGVGFVALLLALTVRFTYMLNYINYDMATEYLVYAHATPDIKRMLSELDLISERTVGARNVVVAYDDDTSWPLSWYMRLYPNARFYGANPNADVMSSPVVIVGSKNYEAVRPYVSRDYVKRTYRQVWWPDQGYYNFTWDRFVSTITDPVKMKNIADIIFYRRYADSDDPTKPRDLTKWPNRHEFEMYVRRDIAEQIWDLNVTPIERVSNAQEELLRQRTIDLPAVGVTSGVLGDLPLLTPRAIAIAPSGLQAIADTGNHRVVLVDANGAFVRAFGSLCKIADGEAGGCVDPDGSGPLALGDGQFQEPWGIAVNAEGMIFVADTWNGRIQVFDADGNFVRKWGYFNTTNGTLGDPMALFGPRGIAIDSAGNLLVADTGNKRILQFTATGELVNQVGGGGVRLGNFEEPTAVAVDPRDGNIFVADAWNRRIQKLDVNLQPLAEWPVPSWGSQHLYYKPYLTVAGNGDVYASDPENFRVLVYNSAGGVKATFGSYGSEMNRFGLPNGLAWNGQSNLLMVVDADNQRVMSFAALP